MLFTSVHGYVLSRPTASGIESLRSWNSAYIGGCEQNGTSILLYYSTYILHRQHSGFTDRVDIYILEGKLQVLLPCNT